MIDYPARSVFKQLKQITGAAAATTVLLVRHAHTDAIGVWLTGRAAGVPLSERGCVQAQRLGVAIGALCRLAAIYTSPLERARTTAAAVAQHQSIVTAECAELSDIDFGEWTGKTFAELEGDPRWHHFNRARGSAHVPGGEQPADVQARALAAIARLAARHAGDTIAIVSHADVVRFALLHYTGQPLDLFHRIDVDPASVSAVTLSAAGAQVLYVNDTTFAS